MFDFLHVQTCPHCNTEYAAMTRDGVEEKVFRCMTGANGLIERDEHGTLLSRAQV